MAQSKVRHDRTWHEEPIDRRHDRTSFDCGVAPLNEYLAKYARQNHVSGGAKTFVAVSPAEPTRILGFYSISLGAILFEQLPNNLLKRLGRYDVPAFRLARLAVDLSEQGKLLGTRLLFAAARRALSVADQVGGAALAIDAKDEGAARWYARFGAVPLRDSRLQMILPLDVMAAAIRQADSEKP